MRTFLRSSFVAGVMLGLSDMTLSKRKEGMVLEGVGNSSGRNVLWEPHTIPSYVT